MRHLIPLLLATCGLITAADTVRLSDLDLSKATSGWSTPVKNRSIGGNPLRIAGTTYEHGFGTHAWSRFSIALDGGSTNFRAIVGLDDEANEQGSVSFVVIGDGKELWHSKGTMRRGQSETVNVDVTGIKTLLLWTTTGGDTYGNDHADWANAEFTVTGVKPKAIDIVREDWENPTIQGVNKAAPSASMIACPDANIAKTIRWTDNAERCKSPWYQSLNGTWKFHYGKNLSERVSGFAAPNFNDATWPTITVPATMEFQGFGVPIYVNSNYPWKNWDVPFIPPSDFNTVGSYRRTFTVPTEWSGRPVHITFDGVYSFFYLWVNGTKVGLSKDSRDPAEFDISAYVKPGENTLAVEVFRWTDASYIEDQDTWRMNGIYRDVYLWSPPSTFIRDLQVRTPFDATYTNATLDVTATVRNAAGKPATGEVSWELLDAAGRTVATSKAAVPTGNDAQKNVVISKPIAAPHRWNGEDPYRYLLLTTLKDTAGTVAEVVPTRIGFRQVEIKDGRLLVNGQAILIKGVDRHEQSETGGFTVNATDMRRDIELMKQLNVNAVRTCHYPNSAAWYDLCDEYGIYLAAEGNIECHGLRDYGPNPTGLPEWGAAYLDRTQRNIETNKNHPSVILWSLGNESGGGLNMKANHTWAKDRDPTRPTFYDEANNTPHSDLISNMYMKPETVAEYITKPQTKPLILCEYAYARGNASGDLWSYWNTFYQNSYAQGAFIWDFQDRAFAQPISADRQGRFMTPKPGEPTFWAYGGDFGPKHTPSDDNMVCNGIVGTDRKPHPGAFEVKHVYQDIHCKAIDLAARRIAVTNFTTFTNLKDLAVARWKLTGDGVDVQSGTLPAIDCAPRATTEIRVPVKAFVAAPGVEYHLDVSFTLARDTSWAKAGHELAWDQFQLPDAAPKPTLTLDAAPTLTQDGERVTVRGRTFSAVIDRRSGGLSSLVSQGTELIAAPLAPHFWRAPVDNDRGYGFDGKYGQWRHALDDVIVSRFEAVSKGPAVIVTVTQALPKVSSTWDTTYTIHGSGDILVDAHFTPGKSDLQRLPRLGMRLAMAKGFEQLRWFGRGPYETYSDRIGARVGTYASTVDEQVVDYTRPSEMGNKVDVRWLAVTNGSGVGLLAVGEPLLSTCALHYTAENLDGPRHLFEVKRSNETWLNLDLKQLGVGGDDGWGAQPHVPFQIPCQPYQYQFRLRPIGPSDDIPALGRSELPKR